MMSLAGGRAMEIGIGLDQSLGLSWEEHRQLAREAAQLGYTSAWTNASVWRDPFQVCGQWSTASAEVVPGGLGTGISVVPVPLWRPVSLASAAASVSELSGGRFMLGIGSGRIHAPAYARTFGQETQPPIALVRDWLRVLRGLLAGQAVEYEGKTVALHGAQINVKHPPVPLYVGALGPQMLRLAGEASDGAALNWCTPETVAWSRERCAEGARKAGRDPAEIAMVEYIRICVDDDEDAARRAFTKVLLGYALAQPGVPKHLGYRGHFARMGFDEALGELEARRDAGASEQEIVENFPRDLAKLVGYYGPASGAAAAFERLSAGLDLAIVRVVPARKNVASVRAVMEACAPARQPARA
jgi:alkanesulfonate monooxygenase SsuD/methylene tetrahydromethanopterin reductase-like flavin-dependent oxidoreductase (luciferase family)